MIYIKNKLASLVESDPKPPFSIATTPRGRGGRLDCSHLPVPSKAECKARGYQVPFLSLCYDSTWD